MKKTITTAVLALALATGAVTPALATPTHPTRPRRALTSWARSEL